MITQEQLDDAILVLTGKPEWAVLTEFLMNEAIQSRDLCADAKTWEQVQKLAGFAEGLAFVLNLRQMTEMAQKEDSNADV